jgi:hypothetical protein
MKIEKSPRHKLCNFLFTLKALFAIVLGSCAVGLEGFKVFDMHKVASSYAGQRLQPVIIDPSTCFAPQNGLAKLEPAKETLMLGIHLDWQKDIPSTVSGPNGPLGVTPGVL